MSFMKMGKTIANRLGLIALLSLAVSAGVSAAGNSDAKAAPDAKSASFTFRVAFENKMSEPIGQGLGKWKDLVAAQNKGVAIELYPDSQLGAKSALMDSMLMGDNVVTLTDGSFYADYGVPEFSVFYAPFLFDNWDQVWKLVDSQWYADMCRKLDEKGMHIIASNWIYGSRQLMTKNKVLKVEDLKGKKIRVPTNVIQTKSFEVLGGTSVAMPLGDVYQALMSGVVDGVENPLATLDGRSFQEVCKYILMTDHVMNSTTWVCSSKVWNGLSKEQQQFLTATCQEAGKYNNQIYEQSTAAYLKKMQDAGVTVSTLTPSERQAWKDKAKGIWDYSDSFKWSKTLYADIQKILK